MHGTIHITRERDLICTVAEGLIRAEDVDRLFSDIKDVVDLRRRLAGQVRVLVDLRDGQVQTPETAERMRQWNARIHPPEDKVAFVVTSALLKSQVRRVGLSPNQRFFDSSTAARVWLRADAEHRIAEAVAR